MILTYVILGLALFTQLVFLVYVLKWFWGFICDLVNGDIGSEIWVAIGMSGLMLLMVAIPLGAAYLLYLNPLTGISAVLRCVFWLVIIYAKANFLLFLLGPKGEAEQWGVGFYQLFYFVSCIVILLVELGFYSLS